MVEATIIFSSVLFGSVVAGIITLLIDKATRRREKRLTYLIELYQALIPTYRRIESAKQQGDINEINAAISEFDIKLLSIRIFGSACQIEIAEEFRNRIKENATFRFDELDESLVYSIRKELGFKL